MDKKTEKKPSDLKRLFGYAGNFRFLTVASIILSAVSAVMALAPFVFIWKIIKEVLDAAPDLKGRRGLLLLRNNQKTPFNEQGLFWQRTIILIEIVQGCSAILKRYF